MENHDIAAVLDRMADLLEIQDANPFRVRAYRNAVRTISEQTVPMRRMLDEGENLADLPGIGKEMSSHIGELVETGRLALLAELGRQVPESLVEMIDLPGVGPKKARRLWQELDIASVEQLEEVAKAGRVAGLPGFGAKSEQKILKGIEQYRQHQSRVRISDAELVVEPLLAHLRGVPGVQRVEAAGSYRRRTETVGDIDLLVVTNEPGSVMSEFTGYPGVDTVEKSGDTRGTVILKSGLQVDLRVVPPQSSGAAWVYFTGSKEHNIRLRKRALERGLRLSEYGVFREEPGNEPEEDRDPWAGEQVAGETEKEVYAELDLPWIPPELREDRGEVEEVAAGELPELIELADMRGDLQMHSTWSDGKNSIEEMLEACVARGYDYFALTDHSKALAMTGGLDAERLREQWLEIEEVASRHEEIRLLRSLEVDILAEGDLDLEDEMLEQLDLVVVSVHSRFELPAVKQTERILTAIRHPRVDVLAHPTGRLINRRAPFEFDLDEVLRCAKECNVAVELNANPARLDLKDTHLMRARELGVKVVISTDAHRARDLDLMRFGIDQARRAGLTRDDVLNAQPLDELFEALGK